MSQVDELVHLLGANSKTLVIQKSLSPFINSLISFTSLKNKSNIINVCWFSDSLSLLNSQSAFRETNDMNEIVFFIESSFDNLSILTNRINELLSNKNIAINSLNIKLLLVKDLEKSFEFELKKLPIYGEISAIEYWETYTFDESNNLYNLNLNSQFNSLYLNKTTNLSYKLALFLHKYLIKNNKNSSEIIHLTNVIAKGTNSVDFLNIFKDLNEIYNSKLSTIEKKTNQKLIENFKLSGMKNYLFVFERNLDFLSVLLNQLNFSGLIDEIFKVNLNSINLNNEIISFNDNDLFNELENMNFGIACDELNSKAKFLQSKYDSLKSDNNTNSQLKKVSNFVNELSDLEALKSNVSVLTKVSESLINQINSNDSNSQFNIFLSFQQDILLNQLNYSAVIANIITLIIEMEFDITLILRLISITSIINNGIKERDLNQLSNEIIEYHGIKYLLVLQNMIKIGLIEIRGTSSSSSFSSYSRPPIIKSFQSLSNKFNLITDDESDELMFSYRNYVPLIPRIIQSYFKNPTYNNSSSSNNNRILENDLSVVNGEFKSENFLKDVKKIGSKSSESKEIIIIVLIGGITLAEVSILKKLESLINKKFMIVSDEFINGNRLISEMK